MAEIMFNKIDADHSGSIDFNKFQLLCGNLGFTMTNVELQFAMKIIDKQGTGRVELEEFKVWWNKSERWTDMKLDEKDIEVRKSASQAFQTWDADNQGMIAKKDFEGFYTNLISKKLTIKDKASCLKELDKNNTGHILFTDYVDWLKNIGTIKIKVKL